MPVSPLPVVTWLILFALIVVNGFRGKRAFAAAVVFSVLSVAFIWFAVSAPGFLLQRKAAAGAAVAQFEYARFVENKSSRINAIISWPTTSDVLGGYKWLLQSAKQNHPPALYALGVRLKHGIHVPEPPNWTGPAGNRFPQPDICQWSRDHKTMHTETSEALCQESGVVLNIFVSGFVNGFSTVNSRSVCRWVILFS